MSRTMDDKEDKDDNNNNKYKEHNLRESSSSSSSSPSSPLSLLPQPILSSTSTITTTTTTTTTTTCTPLSFNRSLDSYSFSKMGRKNFKPESVSCLTQKPVPVPVTTVNQLDNQSINERMIKMKQFQSSSSSSSLPSTSTPLSSVSLTTTVKPTTPTTYHPHHYHHHRHHHHQQQHQPMSPSSIQYKSSSYYHYKHDDDDDVNKDDVTKIPKENVNILKIIPTPQPKQSTKISSSSSSSSASSSSTVRNSGFSVNSIEDYSVSMRKSDNSNPLGLPNWSLNQQQTTTATTSSPNINSSSSSSSSSLIKKLTNPIVGGSTFKAVDDETISPSSSSPSPLPVSSSSKVIDPISSSTSTSSHHHHHHPHPARYHYRYHTHQLHSPRTSKRILSCSPSTSHWLHRSASDPGMDSSSAAYSTHTSALLLTTGAYSGSPNYLSSLSPSSSPNPSPSPSSTTTATTTRVKTTLPNKSYSPFCISPIPKGITKTTTTSTPSSLSSSPTPPCYFVPSSSSNASSTSSLSTTKTTTTTLPPRSLHLTGSPTPSASTNTRGSAFNKQNQQQSSAARVNPSLSPSPSPSSPPPPPLPPTNQPSKLPSPSQSNLASTTSDVSSASQFFSSQTANTKRCVLRLDGYFYLIVNNKCRDILDEEDDLSEVQPDAVPYEVREWLASTFTRNNTAQKRRSEEKPKFRSVANAIRAGIMVDRLYRRLCFSNMVQIPPKIADRLKSIDSWSYDCFKLNEASNNQVLKYISYELLNCYGLVHKFKIPLDTLESCLNQFEQGYTKFKNPYHNNIHAADVTQTVHYMLSKMGLVNWLTDLEIFATLLAAIIHDFQHTGTTNNFHVMSESETALLYNDRAVLENFHVSAAFRILRENDCNILVNLNKEEYRELRTLVIDMVLATDMSSHFQQIKTMKSLLSNVNEFTVDKSKALSLVLHCCDISHPSKQWDIHRRWTELLLEEFFRQGDKERELGLPYSPLCDRNTTLVAESQIGFIDFIVAPSLEVCGDLLDKIYQHLEGCRHSPESLEESLDERLPDNNGNRPKSLSAYKNKRGGLSVDSAESSVNSRPVASAPASPRFTQCTSFGNCKAEGGRLKRPWSDNLGENRKKWQERAAIDAIQREQNARKQTSDGISLSMSPESEL